MCEPRTAQAANDKKANYYQQVIFEQDAIGYSGHSEQNVYLVQN